jgi:DNA-binding transcriptional regulator YiaG
MEAMIDVKQLREARGLTQAQFAKLVGVDQSTVSNWEKGMSPRGPAQILLRKLADAPSEAAE